MKRAAELRLVVTVYTTAAAMAIERLCREEGIPGRIIPAPRSLTSDCGLAWSMAPEDGERLTRALTRAGIETAGTHEMYL